MADPRPGSELGSLMGYVQLLLRQARWQVQCPGPQGGTQGIMYLSKDLTSLFAFSGTILIQLQALDENSKR